MSDINKYFKKVYVYICVCLCVHECTCLQRPDSGVGNPRGRDTGTEPRSSVKAVGTLNFWDISLSPNYVFKNGIKRDIIPYSR